MRCKNIDTNTLVIGAGIAGLKAALEASTHHDVVLIAKGPLVEANSYYAQGGIAGVLSGEDSFEKHIADTLKAGAGLCHADLVKKVVEHGPSAIKELIDIGVEFTKTSDQSDFHLTKEGGHSERRVIHAEDLTGKAVMEALIAKVKGHPRITVVENQFAVDLLTSDKFFPQFNGNVCLGAYILDRSSDLVYKITSRTTILATGGHGRIYRYTTNPESATGDGLAMAWRAGCKVANLEFMQFHPTTLYHPEMRSFLISEAVRGEGAVLRNHDGVDFTKGYHPMGSLAPRDIVARAIDSELKRTGEAHVYLDATVLGEKIQHHFPNIFETCSRLGLDIHREWIPVVPSAHYSCGGVVVDDCGRTSIKGLYAIGEVACSGLHGANRLASNSLLEALVFSKLAANAARKDMNSNLHVEIPEWDPGSSISPDEQVVLSHTWDEIRRLMWNYVGIVRTNKRLNRAYARIKAIRQELEQYYWDYRLNDRLLEVRNLAEVAHLTIRCAMKRKESRGIHFNLDYSEQNANALDTIVW